MTPRLEPGQAGRPRFRFALAFSVAGHLALLAVPVALWRALAGLPGPGDLDEAGRRGGDFLVVSLLEEAPPSGESPSPQAPARVAPPPRREEPRLISTPEPVPTVAPSGGQGEGEGPAGQEEGEAGSMEQGAGDAGAGGSGEGAGTSAQYRPPRLLAGALPLTPQESESLPSPLEIPVRLHIGLDGRVISVEPADAALPEVLRDALERSARAMRFLPARLGEEPVEAVFTMTFIYRR